MNNDAELWKEVVGYEGYYEVSSVGRVRSVDRVITRSNGRTYTNKGKIRATCDDGLGYEQVSLSVEGKYKSRKVHRLVANAFITNPENKLQVNHIDGNKKNNIADNLEWVTNQENQIHAKNSGLYMKNSGINHFRSKLDDEKVRSIRKEYLMGASKSYLGNKYGVNPGTIYALLEGKTWRHVN